MSAQELEGNLLHTCTLEEYWRGHKRREELNDDKHFVTWSVSTSGQGDD
jgi:hypothetical protein